MNPDIQTTLRDGEGADFNGGLTVYRKMFMSTLSGKFTLFVPTDLAFNQFLQKLGGIKEVKILLQELKLNMQKS